MNASKSIKARLANLEARNAIKDYKGPIVDFSGESVSSGDQDRPLLTVRFVGARVRSGSTGE